MQQAAWVRMHAEPGYFHGNRDDRLLPAMFPGVGLYHWAGMEEVVAEFFSQLKRFREISSQPDTGLCIKRNRTGENSHLPRAGDKF